MALKQLDLIGHSGFALECEKTVLVFDLFIDPESIMDRVAACGKPVVFFSSHAHHDHWNTNWLEYDLATASYVVDSSCDSDGLRGKIRPDRQRLTVVEPYQRLAPADLFGEDADRFMPGVEWIRTFGSTDMGVSFLVSVEGKLVFHAGDLNDWYWADESTEKELSSYELAFRRELRRLADDMDGLSPRIMDLACFPVDGRLGEHATRGAMIFIARFAPAFLAPMHMIEDEKLPDKLADKLKHAGLTATEVLRLSRPGQSHTFA